MSENSLENLLDFLNEISLKEIDIPPHLKIPDWPRTAGKISIDLGRRDYYTVAKAEETGLFRIIWNRRKTENITFTVEESGTFHADFFGSSRMTYTLGTKAGESLGRIRALLIFHQFKEEIYEKIAEKLRKDLPEHDQVAALVRTALKPFVNSK